MNRNTIKNKTLIADWWSSAKNILLKHAERLTGDPETAKDLIQQVALAVITYGKPFNSEEHFLRWSFQKLRWLSLDYFRKRDRERAVFDTQRDIDAFSSEPTQEGDRIVSELFGEIQKLPGRQKDVANRYYIKQDDMKIIAADLQIDPATVRSYLRHARSLLAERFKRDEIEKDKRK